MSFEEMHEYSWLSILPDERQKQIEHIHMSVQPVLNTNLLPHLTDHSIHHSRRVVERLGSLLATNLASDTETRLCSEEVTILVLAALLHDISLQIPKAHGVTEDVVDIPAQTLGKIRMLHGEVSGVILRELADGRDNYGLNGLLDEGIRKILPFVASVCEKHQSSVGYDPSEIGALGSRRIRVGLLTALLRLADTLDCDSRRVRMDCLKCYSVPISSIYHWLMCQYVDGVTIEDGNIEIHASYPKTMTGPVIQLLSRRLLDKIYSEYRPVRNLLWKNRIMIQLPEEIHIVGVDYSYGKQALPEEIVVSMRDDLVSADSGPATVDKDAVGAKQQKDRELDFMSYWGFVGNPFLDRPVYYGSDLYVETPVFSEILGETKRNLEGRSGDLRLIIGGRGMGKTTLFQTIQKRFEKEYDVHVIDVADEIVNVRSATDLHALIQRKIRVSLKPDESDPDPDRIIELARFGRKKVLCLDSLDRLPEDRFDIVRDFFKTSQKFLTALRGVSVCLMAFAESWGTPLSTKEFSYLGMRNQKRLEPFSTEQARKMLDNRLRSSGRSYSEIFDEDCILPLLNISGGNPRMLLEHSEAICRQGARAGVARIGRQFIRESYQQRFDDTVREQIHALARSSTSLKKGITSVYVFYLEMERRNLNLTEGWDYLLAILKGGLSRERVAIQFYSPLNYVAYAVQKDDETSYSARYVPHKFVEEFFVRLKKQGVTPEDFVSYYSANPIPPVEEGDDVLISTMKSPLLQGEDLKHQERARQLYFGLREDGKPPFKAISEAWDSVEEMIIAILMRHSKFGLEKYESRKEEAYYYDRLGIKKQRGTAGEVLSVAAKWLVDEFTEFLKANRIWMSSYHGMKWIVYSRNNILRGRAQHLTQYGEKERDLCLGHMEQVFKELNRIYG